MSDKRKAAELTAGILVKKGAAGVSPGVSQRGTEPPRVTTLNAASEELKGMHFKVPKSFQKEFADYAYHSDRKMVDVLKAAFLALKKEEEGRR